MVKLLKTLLPTLAGALTVLSAVVFVGAQQGPATLVPTNPKFNVATMNTVCVGDGTTTLKQVATNDLGAYTGATACVGGTLRFDVSTTTATFANNLVISGAGPHAFGAAADTRYGLLFGGTFSGTSTTVGLEYEQTLAAPASFSMFGMNFSPTFIEAASGVHALIATQKIGVATVTPGVATVTDTASLYLAGPMTATVTGANYAMWVDAGNVRFDGDIQLNSGQTAISSTPPTIASGGCTSPAITDNNGTESFKVTLGSSCAGVSTFTLTLPAAAHRWSCNAHDLTTPATYKPDMTAAASTTTAVITNYNRTTGLAVDFVAAEVLQMDCHGG